MEQLGARIKLRAVGEAWGRLAREGVTGSRRGPSATSLYLILRSFTSSMAGWETQGGGDCRPPNVWVRPPGRPLT